MTVKTERDCINSELSLAITTWIGTMIKGELTMVTATDGEETVISAYCVYN